MAATKEALIAKLAVEDAYVRYYQTRITTGVYKKRIVHVGGDEYRKIMSEDQLLDDEIDTMHRHIHAMSVIADKLAEQ